MQNFKDVCGNYDEAWFEMEPAENKKFLEWAKNLGCVWSNGDEINPTEKTNCIYLAINSEGKLRTIPILQWSSKKPSSKNIKRYVYREFIKNIKTKF